MKIQLGHRLPDARIATVGGRSTSLAGFRGGKSLIFGWGSWSPSREALPGLQRFCEEQRSCGLETVSIAFEVTGPGAAMKHLKPAGADHSLLIDATCTLTRRWGVRRVPFLFLLDEEGRVLLAEESCTAEVLARVAEAVANPPRPEEQAFPEFPADEVDRQYQVEILMQACTNLLGRNRPKDALDSLRKAEKLDPENVILREQASAIENQIPR